MAPLIHHIYSLTLVKTHPFSSVCSRWNHYCKSPPPPSHQRTSFLSPYIYVAKNQWQMCAVGINPKCSPDNSVGRNTITTTQKRTTPLGQDNAMKKPISKLTSMRNKNQACKNTDCTSQPFSPREWMPEINSKSRNASNHSHLTGCF